MPGLVDIGPMYEEVDIGSAKIEVSGITAEGAFHLLRRFPEIRKAMSGVSVDVEELMGLGPEIISAVIAAGIGFPNDKVQEAAARKLSIGHQVDVVSAILRVSFPKGLGALVQQVDRLASFVDAVPSSRARGSASQSPSKSSSTPGTEEQPGSTPSENLSGGSGSSTEENGKSGD